MASELSGAFEQLTDVGMWENIAVLAAGYVGSVVIENTVEMRGLVDAPNEVYGVAVIVAAWYFLSGDRRNFAMAGGGVYTVDQLARRFGVRDRIMEVNV